MRRRLLPLAVAALLAVGGLTACGAEDGASSAVSVTDVGPTAFAELADDPDVTVLDVRTPQEFAAGHLPDAVNIDSSAPDFADAVGRLPKDGRYLVYCQTSNRSGVATDRMVDLGFTDVYDLQGGIVAWAGEGGEVVTD
ncbi:rhodanese-like domain-containing protein [Actinotalea sp. Marseille-Q4924]|uniref:rhodanese-like domain-containing protein n=1 Tax=Actinotalea sp. Marseille-Q4924 TaxID=2866571 RepID=UPI001CE43FB8|nr:rhodanese-like domain-containing protein [Actinotalea sp. Marseille-Q4924]